MPSVDTIETYVYGTSKDQAGKKEVLKCENIIKQYINDNITNENLIMTKWQLKYINDNLMII